MTNIRYELMTRPSCVTRLLVHIHQVLASNGRGAGMHVNPLEQVFVFTSLVLTISELLLHIYIVLFYPAPRSGRSLGLFVHLLLGSKYSHWHKAQQVPGYIRKNRCKKSQVLVKKSRCDKNDPDCIP